MFTILCFSHSFFELLLSLCPNPSDGPAFHICLALISNIPLVTYSWEEFFILSFPCHIKYLQLPSSKNSVVLRCSLYERQERFSWKSLIYMIETFICFLWYDPTLATIFHCPGINGHPDPSNVNSLVLKNNKTKVIKSLRREINLLKIIVIFLSLQGESGIVSLWHCTFSEWLFRAQGRRSFPAAPFSVI